MKLGLFAVNAGAGATAKRARQIAVLAEALGLESLWAITSWCHPAKQVASLDVLSGGRVPLGVGVGWLAEEFAAVGVPFDDRGRRHDDCCRGRRCPPTVNTRCARSSPTWLSKST